MTTEMSTRIKALKILKSEGVPFGRYMGTHGGNHVFRTKEGVFFGVDLVIEQVTRYEVEPQITRPW